MKYKTIFGGNKTKLQRNIIIYRLIDLFMPEVSFSI